jgi:hypothetical protein
VNGTGSGLDIVISNTENLVLKCYCFLFMVLSTLLLIMNYSNYKMPAYSVGTLMVCITGEKTLGVWPTR